VCDINHDSGVMESQVISCLTLRGSWSRRVRTILEISPLAQSSSLYDRVQLRWLSRENEETQPTSAENQSGL